MDGKSTRDDPVIKGLNGIKIGEKGLYIEREPLEISLDPLGSFSPRQVWPLVTRAEPLTFEKKSSSVFSSLPPYFRIILSFRGVSPKKFESRRLVLDFLLHFFFFFRSISILILFGRTRWSGTILQKRFSNNCG